MNKNPTLRGDIEECLNLIRPDVAKMRRGTLDNHDRRS